MPAAMARSWSDRAPFLCVRFAALELCEWTVWLATLIVLRRPGIAHTWLPAALAAANTLRTCVALVAAPELARFAQVPSVRWPRVAILYALGISGVVQLGACAGAYTTVHLAVQLQRRDELGCELDSPDCASARTQLIAVVIALVVNLLSSTALGSLYSNECRELRGAPPQQPQVTSFVVEEPCLECRDSTCVICLEDISTGCRAGQLQCGHVFHDECVRGWLKRSSPETWCPMRCSIAAVCAPERTISRTTVFGTRRSTTGPETLTL